MHAVSELEHPVLPRTVCDVQASDLADEQQLLGSADSSKTGMRSPPIP
jgi:hypothetical protein